MRKSNKIYLITIYAQVLLIILFVTVQKNLALFSRLIPTAIILMLIFTFILAVWQIFQAVKGWTRLQEDVQIQNRTNRTILLNKLILVPFYILNFVFWLLITLATARFLFFIVIVPVAAAYTYWIMLATSADSISLLYALYKNNRLTKKQFILHTVMQLIFVLDFIDYTYLYFKINRITSQPIEKAALL